jgi:hypothetical protein
MLTPTLLASSILQNSMMDIDDNLHEMPAVQTSGSRNCADKIKFPAIEGPLLSYPVWRTRS